ncbi:Hypothetical protein DAL_32 [Psychrobacter phage D'Alembert]|nr:Hypothetical protein DAL_32 [Psychrobacter phage D'Alembert]
MIVDIKPKDLVWEDCEEYEYPYLEASRNTEYGYTVIQSKVGYSLSTYLLSGGTNAKLEHYFDSVLAAKDFAFSHHCDFLSDLLSKNWDIS